MLRRNNLRLSMRQQSGVSTSSNCRICSRCQLTCALLALPCGSRSSNPSVRDGIYISAPQPLYAGLVKFPLDDRDPKRLYAAIGDAKVSAVDVRDIADVAVAALTKTGHEGKIYDLTGLQALTQRWQKRLRRARSPDCLRRYLAWKRCGMRWLAWMPVGKQTD